MSYVFGIASFNRLKKQFCLQWLKRLGVPREKIFLQTQTEKDYRDYSEFYADAAQIDFQPATTCAGNKNNLLDRIATSDAARGRSVVLCSDNVRALARLTEDGRLAEVDSVSALWSILDRCYAKLDEYGASFFGVYPCPNAFFMAHTMTVNTWVIGCFCGFSQRARGFRFNVEYPIKEDYELSARVVCGGGRVLRFNDLAVKKSFRTAGGSFDYWNAENDSVNQTCAERLVLSYPDFFRPHKTRKNEVEVVGKPKVVFL